MTPSEIAKNWIECFNRKDLDGLLDLYADDAVHLSPKLKIKKPETQGWVRGKPALRAWWRESFELLPTLHYRTETITASQERVVIEYTRQVSGEPDLAVAEVFGINAAGKISRSRVYHGVVA